MIAQTAITAANTEVVLHKEEQYEALYVSAIHVCNPTGKKALFSLAVKPTGAENFAASVVFNNVQLEENETFSVGAIALPKNAAVVVKASTTGVVFTLTGSGV